MEREHGSAGLSRRGDSLTLRVRRTAAGIQVELSACGRVAIAAVTMALGVVAVLAMVDLLSR